MAKSKPKGMESLCKKFCRICKQRKKLTDFHKSKRHSSGIKNECKVCTNDYLRKHYTKNKKSYNLRSRKNHFISKYGISYDKYLQIFKDKQGKCDICSKICEAAGPKLSHRSKVLVVDHCHETGKIRGLLCQTCNQGIGLFKNSVDNLIEAHRYLIEDTDLRDL